MKVRIYKEERFVLGDRAAKVETKLVAHVRILRFYVARLRIDIVVKVVACTQRVVAAKPAGSTMKVVRPALGHHVDNRTVVAAIFRHEVVGDHPEFFGGVRIQSCQSSGYARH